MYGGDKQQNATNPFLSAVVAAGGKPTDTEVWPENWAVFDVFCMAQTQWRVGFSGRTGLDYTAVYPLLDRTTQSPQEWRQMLGDIQTMEVAALEAISAEKPT
jgi:hypothetical protein